MPISLARTFVFACLLLPATFCLADRPTHRFLAADSSQNRIAIVDETGATEWEMKIGPLHDLHMLSNGNVLLQTNWTRLVEIDPKTNRTVWEYDSAKLGGNEGKKIEVHAFQRLADGNTMIVESGVGRIIEVNARGEIVHNMKLQVANPHPHRDTRLVRKLSSGNYLVCQEADGLVREYNSAGQVVWEYGVPLFGREPADGHGPEAFGNQCFSALRLANGNTLIATGNGHSVLEVTPQKEIVWKLEQNELPNIELAWVTTLQQLPNGNIVLGNCHAGATNPQVIEINRDKQVIWTFQDFTRFGNSLTNTQILSTNGEPLVANAERLLFRIVPESPEQLQQLFAYAKQALPVVSAHRGGATEGFPENCIATFENTLQHTFAMLEIDPRLTKDGAIVVFHDATLERTSTGAGRVVDSTLEQLKQLRLKDGLGNVTEFSIPTLDEVLEWARGKTLLVLDQKDVSLAARVKKIQEHQAESYAMLIVSSFQDVQECYAMNPNIMMEVMMPNAEKIAQFEKLGVPWKNVIAFVGHTPPQDRELYQRIHQKGACCMVGSSRNLDLKLIRKQITGLAEIELDYRRYLTLGADLIETDLPTELGSLLYQDTPVPANKRQFFHAPGG